jgi:hypothetical protein
MGQSLEEYLSKAIVETVYGDLTGIENSGLLIKKYSLAKVFKEYDLSAEFLLKQ